MTCDHYEGHGIKKHFKIDDKLKCKLCNKILTKGEITKLKSLVGIN